MTTPREVINAAHRLLGQVQAGDALPEAVFQEHLLSFNRMVDSWSTERLAVYNTVDQVFTWPASTSSRTLGPTGNFVGVRPTLVDDATYFRDASTNVSFGIKIINQQQYNGIAVKTVTSTYPQVMWINMENPDILATIYPVPTRELEWHFVSAEALAQPALLSTTLVFPPGYERAFVYALACEIANEFGVEPSRQVQRIAMVSKRDLKRVNAPDDIMSIPYSLTASRQRFNVYSGNY
jgi:hypothetical protein